jgi:hypothetical protein
MEQGDLKRFYRTLRRELNNSKERYCILLYCIVLYCIVGAILYMGTVLQTNKKKRTGQKIEE